MTPAAIRRDRAMDLWFGYAAALWALIFAVLHIVWALGWYIGLDPVSARAAFAKTPFLVYDLVVAALCAVAVPVALALVRPWGQRFPRPLIGGLAWIGAVLLALRGGAGLAQAAYFASSGRSVDARSLFWELWFCLGAVLFGVAVWRFRSRPAGAASS